MPNVCRIGDTVTGTCRVNTTNHPRPFTGVWTTCSGTIIANNLGVIRVGDTGITDCGHIFVAIAGSSLIEDNGVAMVRVGDPVQVVLGGEGIAATGSPNILCD